jgi:hypothetical protein
LYLFLIFLKLASTSASICDIPNILRCIHTIVMIPHCIYSGELKPPLERVQLGRYNVFEYTRIMTLGCINSRFVAVLYSRRANCATVYCIIQRKAKANAGYSGKSDRIDVGHSEKSKYTVVYRTIFR